MSNFLHICNQKNQPLNARIRSSSSPGTNPAGNSCQRKESDKDFLARTLGNVPQLDLFADRARLRGAKRTRASSFDGILNWALDRPSLLRSKSDQNALSATRLSDEKLDNTAETKAIFLEARRDTINSHRFGNRSHSSRSASATAKPPLSIPKGMRVPRLPQQISIFRTASDPNLNLRSASSPGILSIGSQSPAGIPDHGFSPSPQLSRFSPATREAGLTLAGIADISGEGGASDEDDGAPPAMFSKSPPEISLGKPVKFTKKSPSFAAGASAQISKPSPEGGRGKSFNHIGSQSGFRMPKKGNKKIIIGGLGLGGFGGGDSIFKKPKAKTDGREEGAQVPTAPCTAAGQGAATAIAADSAAASGSGTKDTDSKTENKRDCDSKKMSDNKNNANASAPISKV